MPTLAVGPNSDYPTIAAAVAAASPGDTVSLEAGYSGEAASVNVGNLFFLGDATNTGIALTLDSGIATITLQGTAPFSVIDNGGNNTINGNGGANTITVGGGVDTVAGGTGTDTLIVNYATETLNIVDSVSFDLATGSGEYTDFTNTQVTFSGIERFNITTGSGNDNFTTGNGNDIINASAGNDRFDTNLGHATVDGGADNDFWSADFSDNSAGIALDLNLVTTQILGNGSQATSIERITLLAGAGKDVVTTRIGSPNDGLNDTVDGGAGNDTITVGGGLDTVAGGTGTDTLIVNYATETPNIVDSVSFDLATGSGQYTDFTNTQVTFSGIERFQVTTGSGNDNFTTGNGNDTVNAGAGNDTFDTNLGHATVDGGADNDFWSADFSDNSAGIALDLNLVTTQILGNGSQATSIERITLLAGAGNDIVTTRIGSPNDGLNDTVDGGAGNDTITVGGGLDTVAGGMGTDTLIVNYATETLNIVDGFSFDLATGSGQYTDFTNTQVTFSGIERFQVTTGSGNDNFTTGNGADIVNAGAGNDTVNTNDGNDLLTGGAGGDGLNGGLGNDTASYAASAAVNINLKTGVVSGGDAAGDTLTSVENLTGSAFKDTLTGGAGANVINGLGGKDKLKGGNDADTFVFAPGANDDRVLDFTDNNGASDDRLDVSAYGFASVGEIDMSAAGDDAVLALGGGDTIILENYLVDHTLGNLGGGDFIF